MAQAGASIDRVGLAPGEWVLDTSHSSVEFVARHLVVAKVRGRFANFSGAIHIAENLEDSWAEASIAADSIDTRDPKRDEHLRSPDFLDVANFPELTFRGREVRHVEGSRWEVTGDLTIRGVTRPVTLDVDFNGTVVDPYGNEKAVFSASTTINREDFGLTWNVALETGGVVVGKDVRIELEVEAVRK